LTARCEIYLHKAPCEDVWEGESQLQSKLNHTASEQNRIVTEHVRLCKGKSKPVITTTTSFRGVSFHFIMLTIRK